MNEQPFVTKLAEITKSAEADLGDSLEIAPAEWDSVDVLDLIAAIDESYGVTVPTASLNECRTVGDLRALIRSAAAGNA